jgi:hypothetical protein
MPNHSTKCLTQIADLGLHILPLHLFGEIHDPPCLCRLAGALIATCIYSLGSVAITLRFILPPIRRCEVVRFLLLGGIKLISLHGQMATAAHSSYEKG